MAIDGSTALNGSTIANLLTKMWLPGVNGAGGSGTCKELVGAASPTRTLGGSAALSSDAVGSYATVTENTSDYVSIAETLDPTSDGTLIIYLKPLKTGAASWANIVGLCNTGPVNSGIMFGLALSGSGPDLTFQCADNGTDPLNPADNNLVNDTLTCLVITRSGTSLRLSQTGETAITATTSATQMSGNAVDIRIGSAPGWSCYGSKTYVVGYIDGVALNATDAQAVADDIEGELFTAAGGGGQPFAKRFGGVPGAALNRGVW